MPDNFLHDNIVKYDVEHERWNHVKHIQYISVSIEVPIKGEGKASLCGVKS